ncbi:glycosyl transferase family 2 [Stanieria cyanosphaera PCC 7437]|uniref:Glycosyl transferase family 2 n=1 Tax=Stanieria cyanosphaera (strain ATCC 29371 / PCC 7437) TaxID=111780 RepID=K9XUI1_STAC7|nr:glycosyltransferase [Stanieria cyanosphaera]AFZ35719.1 glycosyl transferase family 2 [Stanieria cyanosphaera PCC 7437]
MKATIAEPQVSVIIPTYNCDRYISQAIDSVLQQQNCSYEIIVIDDGSSDRTEEILQPYHDQIRYLKQINQGVAAARNNGISSAKGQLIAFLDADDYFLPGKLAAQAEIFDKRPDLGIVHSGWQRVDSVGNKLLDVKPWEQTPQLNLENWLRWKPVLPSAMMFRRKWLEYAGGFDARFPPAEDTELVLRLAYKGCQSAWLRKITVCYRQHEQSAMHKGLPQARSLSAVIDSFFAQPNLPEKVRLMEYSVRYGTLVWIAWYLYYTDHPVEMTDYLKRAWQYRPFSAIATVTNWVESFAQFSHNWGIKFDTNTLIQSPQWQELVQWIIEVNNPTQNKTRHN